jgi:5S rRNA maturation endonuclease (ribonuclease M5)
VSITIVKSLVLSRLEGVKPTPNGWEARCPAHEDDRPSLSVSIGEKRAVVFNCHATCSQDDVLAALGLTWDQLRGGDDGERSRGEWTPLGAAEAVYSYCDESGGLLFQVVRAPGKKFIQRVPDKSARSGWRYQLGQVRKVPYRLQRVIRGVAECQMIYICEGEKDVHALEAAGQIATCNPGGAGKWKDEYSKFLRDAFVIIVADKDDPGYAHARLVAESLHGIAAAVEIREALVGKDAADHLASGHQTSEFVTIWQEGDPPQDLAPDLNEFLAGIDPPQDFILGNLLERRDRMMITGYEGHGKSTLIRQIGVCAAAGLHPFSLARIQPRKVLQIDCENGERQLRREFRPLHETAAKFGRPVADGMFRIHVRPRGMDLATADGLAWLLERVQAHSPDLLLIGPLYKLHRGDLNDERAARNIVDALDMAREKGNCALITEHHPPHGDPKERSIRPGGSSIFLRWPEFGFGILPDPKKEGREQTHSLRRWRGNRDRSQHVPARIMAGVPGGWPWVMLPD